VELLKSADECFKISNSNIEKAFKIEGLSDYDKQELSALAKVSIANRITIQLLLQQSEREPNISISNNIKYDFSKHRNYPHIIHQK